MSNPDDKVCERCGESPAYHVVHPFVIVDRMFTLTGDWCHGCYHNLAHSEVRIRDGKIDLVPLDVLEQEETLLQEAGLRKRASPTMLSLQEK